METKLTKIVPPKPHKAADAGRAAARAVAGAIPLVGSAAAEIIDGLLPDPSTVRQDEWEHDVSEGVNSAHNRLDDIDNRTGAKRVEIAGGTAAVAKYMIEHCLDGLAHLWTTLDALKSALPDFDQQGLLDGLGELEMLGLIKSRCLIGAPDCYQLSESAYEALDPPIMGWNPNDDAKVLAAAALAMGDSVGVRELDDQMEWPRRRFNPALRIILKFVAYEHISRECQMDYVTGWFMLSNAERAAIRAFSQS